MEALAVVALLQITTAPRFANAGAADRYYQAHDPGDSRLFLASFASIAAVIGVLVLIVDLAPL